MTAKAEKALRIQETIYKTKENENRLTILETNYKAFNEKLDRIDSKLDNFCHPTDGIFATLALQTKTNTDKIQAVEQALASELEGTKKTYDAKLNGTNKILGWIWGILATLGTGVVVAVIGLILNKLRF